MRICIGTITRNRKHGLQRLVASYVAMARPKGCELVFAVVENNHTATVTDILTPLSDIGPVHYELEPQLGIPFARNHVLDISLRENCDFTTFVDDDETVDANWLTALFKNIQARNLDLIGGPVQMHPCDKTASVFNRCIWRGTNKLFEKMNHAASKRHANGREAKILVVTNNWMIRNSFLQKISIRFDESLGLASGSDSVFFRSARIVGVRSGWAPDAIVLETMPVSRMTLRYQYERGRDQTITYHSYRRFDRTLMGRIHLVVFFIKKVIAAGLLLLVAPFTKMVTLTEAARNLGMAVGCIKADVGQQTAHYKDVHSV